METRNIFENISCIDHRYSLSEAKAFEGLSNAGQMRKNLIVILNDNQMSID